MEKRELLELIAMCKTPKEKQALIDAVANKDKVSAINRFDLNAILFDKQLEVITSKNLNKVVVAGRRAGKSFMLSAYLLYMALNNPRSTSLYLTLTRKSAKNIMWGTLLGLIEDYGLPCKPNEHLLEIKFNNGAIILIEGAKDSGCIERLRGLALHLAVLDEAQGFSAQFGGILVSEIIAPALRDYAGSCVVAGTPDPLCKSVLFSAWEGEKPFKNYQKFHWNSTHNSKFPRFVRGIATPETYLQEICDETGYKMTDYGFRREYLGEWCEDKESLVYGFDPERDVCKSLPDGHKWNYVISVDCGFNDADAIVVGAFSYTSKIAYVVECYSAARQDFSELASRLQKLTEKYNPISTVVDPGGGGLKFVAEINNRYGLSAKPAGKYNPKAGGCALMSSDFRKGLFKIVENETTDLLVAQLSNITFITKTDKDGNIKRVVPDGKQVVTANGVIGDDLADACLYLFKECRNYYAVEEEVKDPTKLFERRVTEHMESVAKADQERARKFTNDSNNLWF